MRWSLVQETANVGVVGMEMWLIPDPLLLKKSQTQCLPTCCWLERGKESEKNQNNQANKACREDKSENNLTMVLQIDNSDTPCS